MWEEPLSYGMRMRVVPELVIIVPYLAKDTF
jgi:hypothetical protein